MATTINKDDKLKSEIDKIKQPENIW